jgi:stress-induced morphogen
MKPDELKRRIEGLAPGTRAEVKDLTGTADHYEADVVSPAFEGKKTMERHRMVYGILSAELASGEVHALTLQTRAPGEVRA